MLPYNLNYNILTRKLPKSIVSLLDLVLICFLRFIPVKFVKFITPNRFHDFLQSIYFELNLRPSESDILIDTRSTKISEKDTQNIYSKKIERVFMNYFKFGLRALNALEIEVLIRFLSENSNLVNNRKNYERTWHIYRIICNLAHFNLGHEDYVKFYSHVIKCLNKYKITNHTKDRYLIHYTSNMGHLGFLYLYLNHYQKFKAEIESRRIMLLRNKVANRYFLKLLKKSSKLQIKLIDEKAVINFQNVDTLQISQDSKGIFRLNTPLFSIDRNRSNKIRTSRAILTSFEKDYYFDTNKDFILKLSSSEYRKGLKKLNLTFPINSYRWFVILHLKTNRFGYSKHSEARESDLKNYFEFINFIAEKGGVVIRMGDSSFPKFPKSLPMFDYAHSDVKSEFMDCWLWTQCRWWTGNCNGVSVIPYAFNKPRLMVDQWYWEMNGRETDIVIPKLPVQNGRVMAIKDVFHSKYSRTISLARLRSDGITILNNSPQEIVSGASEMLNLLENGNIDKNTSVNLEMLKFFSQKTKNVMTISPSFACSWAGDLIR